MNMHHMQDTAQVQSLRAEALRKRLQRSYTETDADNSRLALQTLEEIVDELRAMKPGKRRNAALEACQKITEEGRAAFENFDGRTAVLERAEQAFREAVAAHDEAQAAFAGGTLDAKAALKLRDARDVAEARRRACDRALELAQVPAQLPRVVLPKGFREAEEETAHLAALAAKHEIDFDVLENFRTANDPIHVAEGQAKVAKTSRGGEALWWIVFEQRALAELETAERKQTRNTVERSSRIDELTVDELERLFAYRWDFYLATKSS